MGQSVCQKVMWNMQTDPGSDSYLYLICSSEAEFYTITITSTKDPTQTKFV